MDARDVHVHAAILRLQAGAASPPCELVPRHHPARVLGQRQEKVEPTRQRSLETSLAAGGALHPNAPRAQVRLEHVRKPVVDDDERTRADSITDSRPRGARGPRPETQTGETAGNAVSPDGV